VVPHVGSVQRLPGRRGEYQLVSARVSQGKLSVTMSLEGLLDDRYSVARG
jgi:hypothetical protein